jgi:L-arabinose isomerase
VLLNLQPTAALDYNAFNQMTDRVAMTGEWLAYCSACPVPEIANVMRRLNMPFQQVTGTLSPDSSACADLEGWLRAAAVVHALEHCRLGLMGHYYSGMLDIATDLVQVSGRFGIVLQMLEVDELSGLKEKVDEPQVAARLAQFHSAFNIDPECTQAELRRAATTAAALDTLVLAHDLQMLAYYYKGVGVPANLDTMSSIILGTSLLTARGIAVAGEYEIKNVIAMKMLDLLDAGGSFTEYYALDLNQDLVLMGHDGPGDSGIADGRLKVKPSRVHHGKVGAGLSIEMSVRHGAVTLLSVVEDRDQGFALLVAQGECVRGETLRIGNTNSFYRFPIGAVPFVEAWNERGPAHHCAVGTGHVASLLKKISVLLGLPFHQIC